MPVPVTGRRHRVHREHQIPSRDQRGHEQAPVRLDPDHHLTRITGMSSGEVMEPGDPLHALGQLAPAQPPAVLILDMHVMMGFRPVHADKDHLAPLAGHITSRRTPPAP